mgnify:FL=1
MSTIITKENTIVRKKKKKLKKSRSSIMRNGFKSFRDK